MPTLIDEEGLREYLICNKHREEDCPICLGVIRQEPCDECLEPTDYETLKDNGGLCESCYHDKWYCSECDNYDDDMAVIGGKPYCKECEIKLLEARLATTKNRTGELMQFLTESREEASSVVNSSEPDKWVKGYANLEASIEIALRMLNTTKEAV